MHDHGPDRSAAVIRALAAEHDFVRPVWLSRNFGQHAATLAGMASSGGDWVATLDEDGQHDPADVGAMLDVALREQASVVYARPTNEPPHGFVRNTASRVAKWLVDRLVGGGASAAVQQLSLHARRGGPRRRCVRRRRGLPRRRARAGSPATSRPARSSCARRGAAGSGYTLRTLASHFWRMVLTSGTRLLRLVSVLGVALRRRRRDRRGRPRASTGSPGPAVVQGWTSVMVVVLLATGAILFSLGIVAEYLGVAVNMAMGKPLYLITSDPLEGRSGAPPARAGAVGPRAARP